MKKFMKRVCLTLMVALLGVVSLTKANSVEGASTTYIGINNMINVILEDQNGNQVTTGTVKIKDTSGNLYASYNLSTGALTKGNAASLYKMGSDFTVDKSFFNKYISGGTVEHLLYNYCFYNNLTLTSYAREVDLYSMVDRVDHTLEANTIGLYIDPAWASTPEAYINLGSQKLFLSNTTGYTAYSMPTGTYREWLRVGNTSTQYPEVTSSNTKTIYVKRRMKLSELNHSPFTNSGLYITRSGNAQIASGNLNRISAVVFVSGGMISIPVPDAEGYVEVYVEKNIGEGRYGSCGVYDNSNHSGGETYFYGYDVKPMRLSKMPAPTKGFGLMGVNAGKYTLEFDLGDAYASVSPKTIDVKNSDSTQEYKFVVHKHDFNGAWQTDSNKHWKVCCGIKKNEGSHTYGSWIVDKEATEDATGLKHRNCTSCNYKQTQTIEKLPHTHKHSTKWSSDAENHWYECPCGDKKDLATHASNTEATETTAKTCDKCGYIMEPATGHVRHTADTSKYLYDENTHWYKCIGCNLKMEETAHNFEWVVDFEATEDMAGQKHEECSDCGFEKESIEISPIVEETEPNTTMASTEPDTKVESSNSDKNDFNKIWLAVGIAVALGVIIILIIILAKKKKKKED